MDICICGSFRCGQFSVFQLAHLVKVSISVNAWLVMVKPPWKRFGAVTIVPEWVQMIKAELIGVECGWEMGGQAFEKRIWYNLKNDTSVEKVNKTDIWHCLYY